MPGTGEVSQRGTSTGDSSMLLASAYLGLHIENYRGGGDSHFTES